MYLCRACSYHEIEGGAAPTTGIGVSCSADRQCLGKITPEGVFIEQLETEPSQYYLRVISMAIGTLD
jgi:fumarate hydratase, class I